MCLYICHSPKVSNRNQNIADSDSFVLQIVFWYYQDSVFLCFLTKKVAWSQMSSSYLLHPFTTYHVYIYIYVYTYYTYPSRSYHSPWIPIFSSCFLVQRDPPGPLRGRVEPRFAACCAGELCAFCAAALEVPETPKARVIKAWWFRGQRESSWCTWWKTSNFERTLGIMVDIPMIYLWYNPK